MKLVEFTGIPGSGKSSILPIVKSALKKQGYYVFDENDIIQCCKCSPFNKRSMNRFLSSLPNGLRDIILRGLNNFLSIRHRYQVKFIAENMDLFKYILELTNARPITGHHKDLTVIRFLAPAGNYQIGRDSSLNNSVLLIDEGFAHRAVNLFVSIEEKTINFREVNRYLDLIPDIHLLIKIDADEKLCSRRIRNRTLPSRLKDRTDQEISEYITRSKSVIDYAESLLSKKGVQTITLKNDTNKQLFKKSISSQIDHLISNFHCKKINKEKFDIAEKSFISTP